MPSHDPTDLATPGTTRDLAASALALRLATEVVEGLQSGLTSRGFADVRPAHVFAFVRISGGGATVVDIGAALGVTKQSASQLIDVLVGAGYVSRHPDVADGRVWRLQLTTRGKACLDAADDAAGALTEQWRSTLGDTRARQLLDCLAAVTTSGALRPAW